MAAPQERRTAVLAAVVGGSLGIIGALVGAGVGFWAADRQAQVRMDFDREQRAASEAFEREQALETDRRRAPRSSSPASSSIRRRWEPWSSARTPTT